MEIDKMTTDEKYEYLYKVVYEAVKHSHTGKLLISTFYCKQVAVMLGGNYEGLTKMQKFLLRSDIVDERINIDLGISKYLKY